MLLDYIHWNVDRIIFSLGFLTLRWYGLLFALGFVVGYIIMKKIFTQEGIKEEVLDKLTLYMVIGTVTGARLGHCLFYDWEYYSKHPLEILFVWQGGLASHGAAIGITLVLYIFSKKVTHRSVLWILDRIVIVVALAGAFIRIGNLFNSEIYGKPTDVTWAFIFEKSDPKLLPRHPTQIYEALFCIFLFLFLYNYYKRNVSKLKDGFIFGMFLILLFTFRFLVEFVKDVQVDFEKGMTLNMGQWLSIPFVLLGVILLIKQSRTTSHNYLVAN